MRKCEYGDFLQDALRDRLVAGICSEESQRAFFAVETLTFEGACKIALHRGLVEWNSALIQARDKEASLNVVSRRSQGRPKEGKREPRPEETQM